jgi:hypothetical protein
MCVFSLPGKKLLLSEVAVCPMILVISSYPGKRETKSMFCPSDIAKIL